MRVTHIFVNATSSPISVGIDPVNSFKARFLRHTPSEPPPYATQSAPPTGGFVTGAAKLYNAEEAV
jgi:hypothetical protein